MEQREVDNMLLSMIQKHFPSLPLSDEHTDWGKWLGFARAVYEAGRASPASAPEDVIDAVTIALRKAFQLGQTYWQQADSDYISQNKKSDDTYAKFLVLSEEISALLAAAPTPPVSEGRWLPIETAPKDGSKFFAWRRHSTIPLIVFYNAEYDQYECDDGHLVFSLTHWMPLPTAPAMKEGK